MEAVGFHGKQMNGIDYCSANHSKYEVDGVPMPYALTVISAGGYEDDVESPDGEWLWYTGEGGNDLNSSRRQVASQKMKGGNEALLTSLRGVLEAHPGIATSLVPPEHFAASEPY